MLSGISGILGNLLNKVNGQGAASKTDPQSIYAGLGQIPSWMPNAAFAPLQIIQQPLGLGNIRNTGLTGQMMNSVLSDWMTHPQITRPPNRASAPEIGGIPPWTTL